MIALDCKLPMNRAVNVLHPSLLSVLLWLLNIRIVQWKGRKRRNHSRRSFQGKVQIPTLLVSSGNDGHSAGLEPTAHVGKGRGLPGDPTYKLWPSDSFRWDLGADSLIPSNLGRLPQNSTALETLLHKIRCKKSNRSEVTILANKGEALKRPRMGFHVKLLVYTHQIKHKKVTLILQWLFWKRFYNTVKKRKKLTY